MTDKAIILLSGGIDSATSMAIAKSKGNKLYSLSFNYGQRHSVELEASKKIAKSLGAKEHKIIDIDLRQFGASALTDDIDVPKHESIEKIKIQNNIPITYVPARNTIFLSYALAWAEVLKAKFIYIGVNTVDYSGYPDCRPEFIHAFEKMANLATKIGVAKQTTMKIETPLINLSKAQIIKTGTRLGLDYSMTISCYDPDPDAGSCGGCDSCLHRKKGFKDAGIKDPTIYAEC